MTPPVHLNVLSPLSVAAPGCLVSAQRSIWPVLSILAHGWGVFCVHLSTNSDWFFYTALSDWVFVPRTECLLRGTD